MEAQDTQIRMEELKKVADLKLSLRHSNLAPERPDAAFLRTLDSSIKRNTAVIKKLKQINEEQQEGLLEELKSVNVSKFVTEAVTAICDAKLKTSDINAAVQVCSLLHQRYKDFSPNLIQGLVKIFFPGKMTAEDADADRTSRAMRKRSTLRLLVELYFCGVFEDAGIFVTIIKDLTSAEHLKDRELAQTNLSLLVSFARQARVLIGLPVGNQDVQEEIYKELSVTPEQKKQLRKLFQSFFDIAVDLLQSEHGALRLLEQENARMLNAKGELSEENAAAYEKLRKSYDHLLRNISSLAVALDTQPPVMPEDGHTTRVTSGEDAASAFVGKDPNAPEPVWDDEDTRSFYESLPDLRAFVPAVLLGEVEPKGDSSLSQKSAEQQDGRGDSDQTSVGGLLIDVPDGGPKSDGVETPSYMSDEKSSPVIRDKDDKDKGKESDKEKARERDAERKGDRDPEKEKIKGLEGASLDSLVQRLPGCVSRDLIDQLTVDFCYLNSKSNRKKLVRALFNVPRTSLELIPYYSRMIATLSTCMKDVAPMILQWLEEEFSFLMTKKDQMNIETKIRNIRFLGELAKFKVAPPGLIFSCLKCCLDDFTHHNIDVACNLLETCGRFLYRSPETSVRMGNMLEIIMRLKNVKNLDARHSTLVENAYYQCKPPERSARVLKVRPPLHQYIRKLLFTDLDKSSIERVLRQLRKLPWNESESYLLKCFMKVHKGKYSQVHLIASLTAGLSRYHDAFAVGVVDQVLEEIRVGLEMNLIGMQQRRIAYMRFLGELYSYRLIDSPVIFDTLYLIIFFGYGTPEQDTLDPPEDCFRLRMVITLLETCGQFFDRGSSKRRLDRFLLYFQRYVLSKGVIPLDVEFDLQDLFADLRPKMVRFTTFEEANQAILELEERERSMLSEKQGNGRFQPAEANPQGPNEIPVPSSGAAQDVRGVDHAMSPAENGTSLPDEGDSETETESGSMEPDGQDEEEELEEEKYAENDEDGDDEEEEEVSADAVGSEEEEHIKMKQKKVVEVDPAEAEEFERELRALMQESIDSRKLEMRARPTLNMMIPMNLFEGSKDHGRITDGESGDEVPDEQGGNSVRFRVLVKKGNKQQTKQLYIPRDSSLVQSTKQKEAAELEEKQDIKRLVLEYNEREEEDRGGAAPQPMNWSVPSAPNMGRGSGSKGGWDGAPRSGNSRQRRPVAAGYGRRR
ncbi:hypothetical protein R1sor_015765 [Riccia sorocarpa]|uniref:MIF4G domain-containing protein n=1 Tax=Riccia sorocarpa TaxID=122646 RepID=A0ABD3HHB0_9MARC